LLVWTVANSTGGIRSGCRPRAQGGTALEVEPRTIQRRQVAVRKCAHRRGSPSFGRLQRRVFAPQAPHLHPVSAQRCQDLELCWRADASRLARCVDRGGPRTCLASGWHVDMACTLSSTPRAHVHLPQQACSCPFALARALHKHAQMRQPSSQTRANTVTASRQPCVYMERDARATSCA